MSEMGDTESDEEAITASLGVKNMLANMAFHVSVIEASRNEVVDDDESNRRQLAVK